MNIKNSMKLVETELEKVIDLAHKHLQDMADEIVAKYEYINEFCICNGSIWFCTTLDTGRSYFGPTDTIFSDYAGDYEYFKDEWFRHHDDDELIPKWVENFIEDFGEVNKFYDFLDERRLA